MSAASISRHRRRVPGAGPAVVITSSIITRNDWVSLEKSISRIVGVLTPAQSNLVYLSYATLIVALPFVILIGLIAGRQWKLLGAYAAAGFIAVLSLSITGEGVAAPRWHFDLTQRLSTNLSQFLDDPRWRVPVRRGIALVLIGVAVWFLLASAR